MADKPTEADFNKLLQRLKAKDPLFDLKLEYGKLLMIHIDDFTPEQRKRYDELGQLLSIQN